MAFHSKILEIRKRRTEEGLNKQAGRTEQTTQKWGGTQQKRRRQQQQKIKRDIFLGLTKSKRYFSVPSFDFTIIF